MPQIIRAKCPFTQQENLPFPTEKYWGKVPETQETENFNIWYFPIDEAWKRGSFGLSNVLAEILNLESIHQGERAREKFLEKKLLILVDGWYFLKIHKQPTFWF